jgi:hypothetical protein
MNRPLSFWATLAVSVSTVAVVYFVTRRRCKKRRDDADGRCSDQQDNDISRQSIASLPAHLKRELWKEERRQSMLPKLTMNRPMYCNIRMRDAQDVLLCTVSTKKANWYVKKKLASWQGSDTIRLFFTPTTGVKSAEQLQYNQAIKKNQCVVCGADKHFMRHYVVPYCYRSLWPERFKAHLSHDVVLLCPECQLDADKQSQAKKKILEDTLRTDPETAHEHVIDRELYNVRGAASALLRWKHKLPPERILEYQTMLCSWLQLAEQEDLTDERLLAASILEYRISNTNYIPGPELVAAWLNGRPDAIEEFVQDWRRHFLETMEPDFLPTGWSVDNPVQCDMWKK